MVRGKVCARGLVLGLVVVVFGLPLLLTTLWRGRSGVVGVIVTIPGFSMPSVEFPVRRPPRRTAIGFFTPWVSAWRSLHTPGVTGPTNTP